MTWTSENFLLQMLTVYFKNFCYYSRKLIANLITRDQSKKIRFWKFQSKNQGEENTGCSYALVEKSFVDFWNLFNFFESYAVKSEIKSSTERASSSFLL